MAKKKVQRSVPGQIAFGLAADAGCLLVFLTAASALVLGGMIGQGSIDRAALVANGMAVFVGSLLAGRFCAQRKLPMILASCGVYILILLLGNLLFVSAPPSGILAVAGGAFCAALIAALLSSRRPKSKRRRI